MSTSSRPRLPKPVLIVGAGPAGLAAAIELGSRGIPCHLIERNPRAGYAPRAKTTNVRTRTHLRRWGIAGQLADAAPFGVDYPSHIHFVTRLGGPALHRFDDALFCKPERDERYPEHSQWVPQYKLEAVLTDHVHSLSGVEVTFGIEFAEFVQDNDGVRATVRDAATGEETVIEASYIIGADGARSAVRDAIGATMVGTYGLSRNYNTIFEAPGLEEAHPHGPGIMFIQVNRDAPGLIGPMDEGDKWYFMPTGLPPGAQLSDDDVLDMIRRSTGIDLPYRILSSDEWVASRLLADRYSEGRVFLVGDACHLHPPFGGYGMNMGVADSVDLGWKIAAVLQGWGGPPLLDSYEAERRPAHGFVMDEAERNHAASPNLLLREGLEDDTPEGAAARAQAGVAIRESKVAEFYSLGVVLGICYSGSPVVVDDGTPALAPSREYLPSAAPGCLAPHAWLAHEQSLYDLFGKGITLLVMGEGRDHAIASARREADASGTPLTVLALDDARLPGLYGASLALIRPDQVVAWRGEDWHDGVLDIVTGRIAATAMRNRIGEVA